MIDRGVAHLTHAQVRQFSEAVGMLYHDQHDDIHATLIDAFKKLMPSLVTTIEAWNLDTMAMRHIIHDQPSVKFQDVEHVLEHVGHENPSIAYVNQHGPSPVLKISDLATVRQLKETGYYREVSKHFHFKDQASMMVVAGKEMFGLASFLDRAFTEEEMTLLQFFQPHVKVALEQAHRFRALPERNGLTIREQEVLRWIVEGKTDPEIGTILSISQRTVNCHVGKVLDKLGVENRAAAISYVWRWRTRASPGER